MPNFLRVLAHSPELLEGFIALNGALNRISLDPKLRELAYIRASEINTLRVLPGASQEGGAKGRTRRAAGERDRELRRR